MRAFVMTTDRPQDEEAEEFEDCRLEFKGGFLIVRQQPGWFDEAKREIELAVPANRVVFAYELQDAPPPPMKQEAEGQGGS